jgi:acyl carrier protein
MSISSSEAMRRAVNGKRMVCHSLRRKVFIGSLFSPTLRGLLQAPVVPAVHRRRARHIPPVGSTIAIPRVRVAPFEGCRRVLRGLRARMARGLEAGRRSMRAFRPSCSRDCAEYEVADWMVPILQQQLMIGGAKKIVIEHLNVEAEKVTENASFIDDLGADSLDTVELVMAFEEEFNVEIPDDAAESIVTVGDAVKFIKGKSEA